ncbi:MAG: right-handed parallel beta-helix repeat-containing protein, partial [Fibrobacteres bacterium]|nr:right-handed parallel beta-helix repeat-containing protein [Fibrobacterota bacterium]
TYVSGVITDTTVYNKSGNPYYVTGNILVDTKGALHIGPGVEMRFYAQKSLQVKGVLQALGTQSEPIIMTANSGTTPGSWGIINFTPTSKNSYYSPAFSNYTGNVLAYCNISYAGGLSTVSGAVKIDTCAPLIINCRISNSKGAGIIAYGSEGANIIHNIISNNVRAGESYDWAGGGVVLEGGFASIIDNVITNNTAFQRAAGISLHSVMSYTIVKGNTINRNTANGNDGGTGGIWVIANTAEVAIKSNNIANNTGFSGYGFDGGGVKVTNNQSRVIIDSNVIIGNTSTRGGGIDIGGQGFGAIGSAIITNNEICDNIPHGVYLYSTAHDTNVTEIEYNYIHHQQNDGIKVALGAFKIMFNILYSNRGNGITTGEHTYDLYHLGSIRNNSILHNKGFGMLLQSSGPGGKARNNLVISDSINIKITNNYWPMRCSNLLNSTQSYAYFYNASAGNNTFADSNWWGTTIDTNIQKKIHDWNADISFGNVLYKPFLLTPDTNAPISPIQNVRAVQTAGQVRVDWSPSLEKDVAGYKIYSDKGLTTVTKTGKDSFFVLTSVPNSDTIAIAAFDNKADGRLDLYEGHESWLTKIKISKYTQSENAGLNKLNYEIAMSPNPSTNVAYISIKNYSGPFTFRLFNTSGQVVINGDSKGNESFRITTSLLPNGVYYLKGTFEDQILSKKIVIQK